MTENQVRVQVYPGPARIVYWRVGPMAREKALEAACRYVRMSLDQLKALPGLDAGGD